MESLLDTISSEKWIQKAAWNRMVTTKERDQPHKTPVTSTWTADFLTREGVGSQDDGRLTTGQDDFMESTQKAPPNECGHLSMRGPSPKIGQASGWDLRPMQTQ